MKQHDSMPHNPSRKSALTDEQFSELLAGRPSAETLANLHTGDDADLELNDLKSALQNYRSETLVRAERRAATAPSLGPAARRSRMWAAMPQWSLAAVAVVTVAVGVVHFSGSDGDDVASTAAPVTVASQTAVKSSAEDIASDNELLSSIDAALSYHGKSSVDALGLQSVQGTTNHHGSME
jgi:negative regulator of sigma E activity